MNLRMSLHKNHYLLCEGAVIERVRREFGFSLSLYLANAEMIYSSEGKRILTKIYRQYLAIGQEYRVPMLILTPTWRANRLNIEKAGLLHQDVNRDCFNYLSDLRSQYDNDAAPIFIGGLVGCRGDAYKPSEALSSEDAFAFHQFQIEALAHAGVDFLIASTLPAFSEALGIASAMAQTGLDYIISFVLRPTGTLLDATPLSRAILEIDRQIQPYPLCYMANCTHPTVLSQALRNPINSCEMVGKRFLGLQANTSPKSPEELDGSMTLETEPPVLLAQRMADIHTEFGIKILGGCCGTDERHIKAVAQKLIAQSGV